MQPGAPTIEPQLLRRLYDKANAHRWGLDEAQFAAALERAVVRSSSPGSGDAADVERQCEALHLEDLALACACAAGIDEAWQYFVNTYRSRLNRAADAIDPSGRARELADALHGDLFGTTERDGARQSLFRYFHGRSSLATWLRAVLAQRHIDRLRQRRTTEPLDDDESSGTALVVSPAPDPEGPRLRVLVQGAFAAALGLLTARDRLRLRCYYAQQMTLAHIGRLTGEHEATVSRQLSRTRTLIRATVERLLQEKHGLKSAEIDQCFTLIADDPGTLDLATLLGGDGKESALDRSNRGTET
jgi:RNA polymerase sigma-70 factor (ECF subfamily)